MTKWLLALGLSLAAADEAHAFRCGNSLVTEGNTRSIVLARCGEPAEIESHRAIMRRPLEWIDGKVYTVGEALVEISVDVWIYNLGPRKLMRRLRFEDGRLVSIETLGYGYLEQNSRPAR